MKLGGFMGGLDEVFHPHAHNARLALEVQTELPAPAPIPGDRPDLESGRIAIRLTDEDPPS